MNIETNIYKKTKTKRRKMIEGYIDLGIVIRDKGNTEEHRIFL